MAVIAGARRLALGGPSDRQHQRVDRVTLEGDVPAFEGVVRHPGRLRRGVGDEDLAGGRLRREVRRDVDGVAERGEVARGLRAHHPDEGDPRVHARPQGDPRLAGGVAGCDQEGLGRVDPPPGMLRTGHEGEEQRDHLVPDELLDDRVGFDEDVLGDRVEAVHETREVPRRHLSSQLARAADVGEQHRELHLGAVDVTVVVRGRAHLRGRADVLEAPPADPRVLLPRLEAVAAEHERTGRAEGCGAELAPRVGGDEAERALVLQVRVGAAEESPPLLLGCLVGRHLRAEPRWSHHPRASSPATGRCIRRAGDG
jgi:hypothetical protein